jgi:hypothetical protein
VERDGEIVELRMDQGSGLYVLRKERD